MKLKRMKGIEGKMNKIVIAGKYNEKAIDLFKKMCPEGYELDIVGVPEQKVLIEKTKDATALFLRGRVEISDQLLEEAKKLKIMQKWGAGFDQYDMEQIGRYNIPFMSCSGVNAVQVSEMTVALLLALYRRILPVSRDFKNGLWTKEKYLPECRTIHGKKIGVIGIGNIGRSTARLMKAFGATVQYYDTRRLPEVEEAQEGFVYVDLETLFRTSDVITLHVPLLPSTEHMINKVSLSTMKPDSVIINMARSGIVNEKDLYEALCAGTIAGAALDVIDNEEDMEQVLRNPLFKLDNVVITPHMGASTDEVLQSMIERCYGNMVGVVSGKITDRAAFANGKYFTN